MLATCYSVNLTAWMKMFSRIFGGLKRLIRQSKRYAVGENTSRENIAEWSNGAAKVRGCLWRQTHVAHSLVCWLFAGASHARVEGVFVSCLRWGFVCVFVRNGYGFGKQTNGVTLCVKVELVFGMLLDKMEILFFYNCIYLFKVSLFIRLNSDYSVTTYVFVWCKSVCAL